MRIDMGESGSIRKEWRCVVACTNCLSRALAFLGMLCKQGAVIRRFKASYLMDELSLHIQQPGSHAYKHAIVERI